MKTVMVAFTFVAALALSACGGSPSSTPVVSPPSGPPAPAPSPAPVVLSSLSVKSVTPESGATGVAVKGAAVVVVSYSNVNTFSASLDVLCNGTSAKTAVTEANDSVKGELTYSVSYDAHFLSTCSISGTVSGKGTGGASDPPMVTVNNSFTTVTPCTAPAVWRTGSDVCATPVVTKVFEANMLPAGCADVTAACFKNNANFIATGATFGSRAMMIAFFKNPGPLWREALVYADNGTLVSGISGNTAEGGYNSEIDWVMGTATGMIVHDKVSGICYAGDVDSASQSIGIAAVACPS